MSSTIGAVAGAVGSVETLCEGLVLLCESIATVPMIVFPRVIAAHTRQPVWNDHIANLQAARVRLIYGNDVWPLAESREAGPRTLPWETIIQVANRALRTDKPTQDT